MKQIKDMGYIGDFENETTQRLELLEKKVNKTLIIIDKILILMENRLKIK